MPAHKKPEPVTPERLAFIRAELEARVRRRRPGGPPNWWPAIMIADALGVRVGSSRESRRRGVRVIMAVVMEQQADVISSFDGYAIATEPSDIAAYQEHRRKIGLGHLADAAASTRSVAQDDLAGQARLFPESPNNTGSSPMAAGH